MRQVAGDAALVDAAGFAANFQRMVSIADTTEIPIDSPDNPLGVEVRQLLDLGRFPRAAHSLPR